MNLLKPFRSATLRSVTMAMLALVIALVPVIGYATYAKSVASSKKAFVSFPSAGPEANMGAAGNKDYMTVKLETDRNDERYVKVEFTGYAFARSTTDGCPCLVRAELRKDNGTRQIVTRTILGVDAKDLVGDADTAFAERRSFAGSYVFKVDRGRHTYTMSLVREVGTSPTVGFAFGNMQASEFDPD